MMNLKFFKGKKIFITGHTGFKGSWLAYILYLNGAHVVGYSLKPKNIYDNFYLFKLDKKIRNYYCDIRELFIHEIDERVNNDNYEKTLESLSFKGAIATHLLMFLEHYCTTNEQSI